MNISKLIVPLLCMLLLIACSALEKKQEYTTIPLHKGHDVYFVDVLFYPGMSASMLVDTGSGHTVVNEHVFRQFQQDGVWLRRINDLEAVLASGETMIVKRYILPTLSIGRCRIYNVQIAVFPGRIRMILGLSALEQLTPFTISTIPAELRTNSCMP